MDNNSKRYRVFSGYTQEKMADLLNISLSSYRNKEKGVTSFNDFEKIKFYQVVKSYIPNATIENIFFDQLVQKK